MCSKTNFFTFPTLCHQTKCKTKFKITKALKQRNDSNVIQEPVGNFSALGVMNDTFNWR